MASAKTFSPGSSAEGLLILGIGNALRRDDGAGPAVAARLAGRVPEGVEVRVLPGEATGLMDAWAGHDHVIVLDAVASGARPGTLHRFAAADGPLPAAFSSLSSHGLGLAEAIELARALGRLPRRLMVYGIEGEDFRPGEGLSPSVEEAVGRVASELCLPVAQRGQVPVKEPSPS